MNNIKFKSCIQKQITLKNQYDKKGEIIFILSEYYLSINYTDFYIKLLKKNIKKINIEIENNKLNKIFISIKGGTKMEYQFFEDSDIKEIYNFFNFLF